MAPNHKLTKIIKGRKVVGTSNSDGKTIVTFDDGSSLRVKTSDAATSSTRSDTEADDKSDSKSAEETSASTASESEMPKMTFAPFNALSSEPAKSGEASPSDVSPKTESQNAEAPKTDDLEVPQKQGEKLAASDEAITKTVSSQSASTGGTIEAVRQNDITVCLEFEGGGKMEISLLEASSSVMLRGKDNAMEYAD